MRVLAAAVAVPTVPHTIPKAPPVTTIPRRDPPPLGTPIPREVAQNKVLQKIERAMLEADPDPQMLGAVEEMRRLELALPEIANRQPFDATALRQAYGDLARALGRGNARRAELFVDQLAKLSPEERALALERIPYLARPLMQAPPPPR